MRDPFPTIISGNYRPQALCLRVKIHQALVGYRRCEPVSYETNGSENNFVCLLLADESKLGVAFQMKKKKKISNREKRLGFTSGVALFETDGYYSETLHSLTKNHITKVHFPRKCCYQTHHIG